MDRKLGMRLEVSGTEMSCLGHLPRCCQQAGRRTVIELVRKLKLEENQRLSPPQAVPEAQLTESRPFLQGKKMADTHSPGRLAWMLSLTTC